MPRQFKVEGNQSFKYWAIGLALLGAWCVKDGWFPSESVQKRRPLGDPKHENFYLFNKSLAIISFVVAGVCIYVHRVVR